MRRLKLYLDTTILLSMLSCESKTRQGQIEKLTMDFKEGKFEAFISPTVIAELQKLSEDEKTIIREKISEIDAKTLTEIKEVTTLAKSYMFDGIERIFRDYNKQECMHIAYATVYNCDAILSWNFKKVVNFRATAQVRAINTMHRYKDIQLVTPTMIVEDDEL